MGMMNVFRKIGQKCCEKAPLILTVVSSVSTVVAVITAVDATPKAMVAIQEIENPDEHKKDVVKAAWTYYIPTALATVTSIGCNIFAYKIGAARLESVTNTLLATTAVLSNTKQAIREHAPEEVRQAIAERVDSDPNAVLPVPAASLIPHTGMGEDLCYEAISGQYFYGSEIGIQKAVNAVNKNIINSVENRVYLIELFDELNVFTNNSKVASLAYWDSTNLLEPTFSTFKAPNGQPCLIVDWFNQPSFENG